MQNVLALLSMTFFAWLASSFPPSSPRTSKLVAPTGASTTEDAAARLDEDGPLDVGAGAGRVLLWVEGPPAAPAATRTSTITTATMAVVPVKCFPPGRR